MNISPHRFSFLSRRISRLAVNKTAWPLEKILVYPFSPSCSCMSQSSPPQQNVFPPQGRTVSFLRLSPGPTGTQQAASVLHGQHVSLVSWAVRPLPADRVLQEGLVIDPHFVYSFAQVLTSPPTTPTTDAACAYIHIKATKPDIFIERQAFSFI